MQANIIHILKNFHVKEDGEVKGSFEWVEYKVEDRTLNYVRDFLEKSKDIQLDYCKLDLMEFEQEDIVQHHSQVASITDDLYKRILRYGQVENISRIAKKSGAIQKGDTSNNFRDELYYDQNDPFIDDEEYTNAPKGAFNQRMQLAEVFLDDFRTFEGDLKDFVKSEVYKQRVETMHNLEKKNSLQDETDLQNKKKRKPAVSYLPSSNLANPTTNPKQNAIVIEKKPVSDLEREIATISENLHNKLLDKKKLKKEPIVSNISNSNNPKQAAIAIAQVSAAPTALAQSVQGTSTQVQSSMGIQNNSSSSSLQQTNAALSQMLQQQQQQQQSQQLLPSLDTYQKNSLSQFFLPGFSSMLMPNYYDNQAQQLLFNPNVMLYSQNNQMPNNFMYQQANASLGATNTGSGGNSTNSTNNAMSSNNQYVSANQNSELLNNPPNQIKEKKKKKKINKDNNNTSSSNNNNNTTNNINQIKKPQQMNLIEIEDDDVKDNNQ